MPRLPSEYRAIHAAAAKIEPRLARAFIRSVEKLRDAVSINALAMALAARNVRAALRLVRAQVVRDSLGPSGTIVRDATLKGGKVGAEIVNRERGIR